MSIVSFLAGPCPYPYLNKIIDLLATTKSRALNSRTKCTPAVFRVSITFCLLCSMRWITSSIQLRILNGGWFAWWILAMALCNKLAAKYGQPVQPAMMDNVGVTGAATDWPPTPIRRGPRWSRRSITTMTGGMPSCKEKTAVLMGHILS